MTQKQSRIGWIDICKAYAMFAIVFGHTAIGGDIKSYFYSFHVPMFFFLSGVLFSIGKSGDFKSFFVKKVKTIMVPYYIFAIISIAIFMFLGKIAASSLGTDVKSFGLLNNIFGMIYANGNMQNMKWNLPLWFLPCLFVVFILFFIIDKLIIKFTSNKPWFYLIIALGFAALSFINYKFFHISKLPFKIETAVYMSFFFALGMLVRPFMYKLSKLNSIICLVIASTSLVIGFLLHTLNGAVDYVSDSYKNIIVFYLCALLNIVGYVCIAALIKNCRPIEYIGKNTMPILLMHKFPILFFQTILPLTSNLIKSGNVAVTLIVSLVTIAMCLGAGELLRLVVPFTIGYKKRPRKDF